MTRAVLNSAYAVEMKIYEIGKGGLYDLEDGIATLNKDSK